MIRGRKEREDHIASQIDSYHRPFEAICSDLQRTIGGFLWFPNKAEL
jgi:hypothetical protein